MRAPTIPGPAPISELSSTPALALPTAPLAPAVPLAPAPQVADVVDVQANGLQRESVGPVERPAAPGALLRTGWLRRVVIWGSVTSVPGAFVGDFVGAALVMLSAVALVVWSGMIATSVRRTRPATRHGSSPNPAMVILSWFVAPIMGVVAVVGIASVAMWAGSGTFEEQGTRMMVLVVAVFAAGLALLMAIYLPYRALAKCAKWVNSDAGRFRKWFAAPIVAALLAGVVQVLAGLVVLSDGVDGSSSSATLGAGAVWVVSFTLPWLAWLVFGSRAMRSLDLGVAHAHNRAVRESQDPADVDPMLVAQAGPVAAGVPVVNAPSA